jgi:hypothetical protein
VSGSPRKLSSTTLFVLSVLLAALSVGLGRWADGLEGPGALLAVAASLALVIAALFAVFLHWRRLDEAAREAHKAAWYWGGSGGLGLSGLGIGYLLAQPETELSRYAIRPDDAGLLLSGALYVIAAQFVGYLVAWAWWWWSRR